MTVADDQGSERQSNAFLYLYALAVSGGAVAYVPFLTILLPNQAMKLSNGNTLPLLANIAFAGAIAASVSNIAFGWVSDRTGTRRAWIVSGMILSSLLLPAMQFASSPAMLIAMIIGWQCVLNMMLAPLTAWAGDSVPDHQKGLLGGLLAFAPALGALAGALVTWPGLASGGERLVIVALAVVLMVTPVLVFGRPRPMPHLISGDGAPEQSPTKRSAVVRMWIARLFVQVAEATLFALLLLWFRSVAPAFDDNDAATIFAIVMGVAVFVTPLVGRWSDRSDTPILPLAVCALIAAAGLLVMALIEGLDAAITGYVIFGISSSIFLALHSSQTLRVLPKPRNRGRDLGLFNLTNTGPSLVMPWLALATVPIYGFDALFLLLAALALLAATLLFTMPRNLAN